MQIDRDPRAIAADYRGPHGGRPLPIIGDALAFTRDRLAFLDAAAGRSPDSAVPLRIGGPVVLLTHPDDVQHVLVAQAHAYPKGPRLTGSRGRRLFGHGLLTATGAAHRQRRLMLQPAFRRDRVAALCSGISASAAETISSWRDGVEIDVVSEMMRLSRVAVARSLFGEVDDLPALERAIGDRREMARRVFESPWLRPERSPVRARRAYDRAGDMIGRRVHELARARRGGSGHDLITLLASTRDVDGGSLPDDDLVEEVLSLAVTGHETIATCLAWCWLALAADPALERRLHDESDAVAPGRLPGADDLDRLDFAGAVRDEALRIRPPTWIIVKQAARDDVLPTGTHVAAGTRVYVCPWVLHRDRRWFDAPERFDPERFLAPPTWPRYAYIPFGGGPHVCIGDGVARAEITLALTTIARRYVLRSLPGTEPTPVPGLTLLPRCSTMMVVARQTAADIGSEATISPAS
jgi:cytochrome P450